VSESGNAQVVRNLMAALSSRDRTGVEAVLAEDCVWRVPGHSALAGVYIGRREVLGLFGRLRRAIDGPATFDVIDVAESDSRAIFFQYGTVRIAGRAVRMKECLVYRVHDEKIVEVDEFQYDQTAFDATFPVSAMEARR
jgi:ketosteroid isomerase-like protein